MSRMVVVHVAVDRWSGSALTSSLIGAWSAPSDPDEPIAPDDVLDVVRAALGAHWAPATVEQITEWHAAFSADPAVPWEQISLF